MTRRRISRLEYWVGAYGPAIARHVFRDMMWKVSANGRRVLFLTFDDGPTPHLTGKLLDALGKYDVPAAFFLLGKHVALDPGAVSRIEEAGHEIGLHGFDHLDAWRSEPSVVIEDLQRGLELLSSQSSKPVRYFRPPFGRFTRHTIDWARNNGLKIVMWDVMPGDFIPGATHSVVVDRVMKRVRSGSIIVLHDSWNATVVEHTVPALESMLPALNKAGWQFGML
jgi:peptidoglycan/xylan/chitin deacetylase (PgdA/CDA1 family)